MILKGIKLAYEHANQRNWNTIYWAIDLHGVCFPYTYGKGSYKFLGDHVIRGLKAIQAQPESRIILWSACHDDEKSNIIKYFAEHGVKVDYFNENPEITNTVTGNFDAKFYFSILVDDKAGFDHRTDWDSIVDYFQYQV